MAFLLCGSSCVSIYQWNLRNSCHTLNIGMASLLCGSTHWSSSAEEESWSHFVHLNGFSPIWIVDPLWIMFISCVGPLMDLQTPFHWEILITHGKILGTENLLSHCEHWNGCISMSAIFSIWEYKYRNNNWSYYWHFTLKFFLSYQTPLLYLTLDWRRLEFCWRTNNFAL